uniref:hypothetical protein n=1 Tax=Escherichia coli TaxID=562 RepID=UPI001BC8551E
MSKEGRLAARVFQQTKKKATREAKETKKKEHKRKKKKNRSKKKRNTKRKKNHKKNETTPASVYDTRASGR